MKSFSLLLVAMTIGCFAAHAQLNVGSNTAPDGSAMLQVSGSTKGFLPPRMTGTQMKAIASPATGLLIFNTTDSFLYVRKDTGWMMVQAGPSNWNKKGTSIYNANTGGNVGIGTTTPSASLQIVPASSSVNPLSVAGVPVGANTDSMMTITGGTVRKLSLSNFNFPGSLGAGSELIVDSLNQNNGTLVHGTHDYALHFGGYNSGEGISSNRSNNNNGNMDGLDFYTTSAKRMSITAQGYVGIGTTNPGTKAFVEINGTISTSVTNYEYYNNGGYGHQNNSYGENNSLYTAGTIWCAGEVVVTSDERTKTNIATSGPMHDLDLVNKLRVVNYHYKDRIAKGDRHIKGFLAQEVEKVLPDAVSKNTGVVPNIYQKASEVRYDASSETLAITLPKKAALKEGDTLKLITDNGDEYARVASVSGNHFTVSNWKHATDWAFVYGTQVHDMRNLDYNKIFSAGIGAIQQLSKENNSLKKEVSGMKKQWQQMEDKMNKMEERLLLLSTKQ